MIVILVMAIGSYQRILCYYREFLMCLWSSANICRCETLLERVKWSVSNSQPMFDAVSNAALFGKHFYSSLVRISQVWPPEYIPLNHPLIACCVFNPWDALLEHGQEPRFQSYELSKLILGHYSRYWKIGSALLRKLIFSENKGCD